MEFGSPVTKDASLARGLALLQQLVGAGGGQPIADLFQGLGVQPDTFRHKFEPPRVIRALAGFIVQQPTGDTGGILTSPVSSYSILFRQHLPQPSQSASHSGVVDFRRGMVSQNFGRRFVMVSK